MVRWNLEPKVPRSRGLSRTRIIIVLPISSIGIYKFVDAHAYHSGIIKDS
jgi:hypothetical protein